jgi:transposase-like protein
VDDTYARIRGRWHYIYRAIDDRGHIVDAYASATRDLVAARTFFQQAMASSGTTPRRVITDKAGTYPPALATVLPDVKHRTGRYRTNGIERDHGFLKERLPPMRGLKLTASLPHSTAGEPVQFGCVQTTDAERGGRGRQKGQVGDGRGEAHLEQRPGPDCPKRAKRGSTTCRRRRASANAGLV